MVYCRDMFFGMFFFFTKPRYLVIDSEGKRAQPRWDRCREIDMSVRADDGQGESATRRHREPRSRRLGTGVACRGPGPNPWPEAGTGAQPVAAWPVGCPTREGQLEPSLPDCPNTYIFEFSELEKTMPTYVFLCFMFPNNKKTNFSKQYQTCLVYFWYVFGILSRSAFLRFTGCKTNMFF